jgi:Carboxypeptidase regulatory-like domain/PDZ domain
MLGVRVVDADGLGVLTGAVVSAGDGRAVAGARLFFESPAGDGLATVVADQLGAYRFLPKAVGWHRLVAVEADGYVPRGDHDAPLTFFARRGRGVAVGAIALRPIQRVAVRVVDAEGREPLAATVAVLGGDVRATTDADGVATLPLEDRQVVEAGAEGFAPQRARYDLVAQVARRMTIALSRGDEPVASARLEGRVRDIAGEGVEAARLSLRWIPGRGAMPKQRLIPPRVGVSDDDGSFAITNVDPGSYDLVVQAEGFADRWVPGLAVPGPSVDVTLVTGAAIFGEVFDDDGRPLPSFAVVVTRAHHALATSVVAVEQTIDPEGQYEVPLLAPGSYRVYAVGAGAARSEAKAITLAGDDMRLDFRLAQAGTLVGKIVDRDSGAPIEGAKISMEGDLGGDLQLTAAAFSDASGAFRLEGLPALPTSVVVAAAGFHPRISSGIVVPAGQERAITVDIAALTDDEEPKLELAGIGAVLQGTSEGLVINDVVEGGGAAEVGLRAGDLIVTIEGVPATELGFAGSIERLRGPEGSSVTVTVRRRGADMLVALQIPRRRIRA